MSKIYDWFLWIIGYSRDENDEDTISAMLARQKERMGWVWWVFSIGTLFILSIILAFLVWLAIHIINFKQGIAMVVRSPYYKGSVTATEIKEAYEKAFGVSFWDRLFSLFTGSYGGIQLADQAYKEADVELIRLILDADTGDKEEYVAEDFDCDDFAFALMGVFHQNRETAAMPIFITWVSTPQGGHAVLSYYREGEITIIEPQNDEMFPIPEDWGLMLLCG